MLKGKSLKLLAISVLVLAVFVFSGCGDENSTVTPAPNRPYSPVPASGATDVRPDATLSWCYDLPGEDVTVTYDISYGTGNDLILAGTGVTDTVFTPPLAWEDNSTYRWQVTVKLSDGTQVEGPIWNFSTIYGGTWANSYALASYTNLQLYRGIELSGGDLIVAGSCDPSSFYGTEVLLRIDEDGELVWSLDDDLMSSVSDLVLADNDHFLAVGPGNTRGAVTYFDDDGTEIWSRTYGENTSRFDAAVVPSSGYLFGGTYYNSAAGNSDAWLVRTDGNGIKTLDFKFDIAGEDTLMDLIETDDGGFAFCGVGSEGSFITRVNEVCSELWTVELSTGNIQYAISIVQDSDSTISVLQMESSSGTAPFTAYQKSYRLSDGVFVGGYSFTGPALQRGGQIIADDDGGITALFTSLASYDGGSGNTPTMRIERIAPFGIRLWVTEYNAYDPTWGYGLLQLEDGNYVGIGSSQSGELDNNRYAFVVRTTYNGELHAE